MLGSPIVVFVSDPNEVKVENLEREAVVNKPFSFNIDANQAGEGFIRVNIKGLCTCFLFFLLSIISNNFFSFSNIYNQIFTNLTHKKNST